MDEQFNNKLRIKNTKWDRIRKKYINSNSIKTEIGKRIKGMNFIDKRQMKIMKGDIISQQFLNPVLVMDLRHKSINERIQTKKSHILNFEQTSIEKFQICHNQRVENQYIGNELNKFKANIAKLKPKININPKICLNLNNEILYKSVQACNSELLDFPNRENEDFEKNSIFEEEIESVTNFEMISNDPIIINQNRCVRFEENVEVINYTQRSSSSLNSNTNAIEESLPVSDTIDMNNKIEMIGKGLNTLNIDKDNDPEGNEDDLKGKLRHKTELVNGVFSMGRLNEDLLKISKIHQKQPHVKLFPEIHNENEEISTSGTESESCEQTAIIWELFQSKFPPNNILLKKYFLKWIHYTTLEQIEKQNSSQKRDRIQKINSFLDNIRKEKRNNVSKDKSDIIVNKKSSIMLSKKYENKIKIQQDLIELQKIKIERQERMIMELKISKLSEEAKLAKEDIKCELKNVTKTGDIRNRMKAKTLQLVANLRNQDNESFAQSQGNSLVINKFLVAMQQRAFERSVKYEQAKERRLKLEAKKEAAKHEAEEAKRLENEETKRQRIEMLKEKRRQEKMAKILKEREHARFIENNKKCNEFYRQSLLRNLGMECFKRLIKIKRKNQRKSEILRKHLIKKHFIIAWKIHTDKIWENKKRKAEKLRVKLLKKTIIRKWKLYYHFEKSKNLVAIDWHELKITEYCFQQWIGHMKLQNLIEKTKIRQAESHYIWHMKWKILDRWQRLPQVLQMEKATDKRRQRWRLKIWELLPDYTPNCDDKI